MVAESLHSDISVRAGHAPTMDLLLVSNLCPGVGRTMNADIVSDVTQGDPMVEPGQGGWVLGAHSVVHGALQVLIWGLCSRAVLNDV